MLSHTFIHLPGITPRQELALWSDGLLSWNDLLTSRDHPLLSPPCLQATEDSALHLASRDAAYFSARLPASERWRLYRDFHGAACYLDIETTGTRSEPNTITVVGLYDGQRYQAFVRGHNLHEFPQALSKFRLVVTFNGLAFDAPVIEAHFGRVFAGMAHLDIMHPLRALGLRGGLKQVERSLGLVREGLLDGMDGYDAVLLWREYLRGNPRALDTLVRYNAEDVVALPTLAAVAYNKFVELTPHKVFLPEEQTNGGRPGLDLPYHAEVIERIRRRRRAWREFRARRTALDRGPNAPQ